MKKLLILFTFIGLLNANSFDALFATVSGVASNDALNVRAKPNWHSKKLTQLPPNSFVGVDRCIRVGRSNWCKVYNINRNLGEYHDYSQKLPGWVNAKFLKFSNRGYVAIKGKRVCNYSIGCNSGVCKVVNLFRDVTIKNKEVVDIKVKKYPRSWLRGIGELDIDSGGEGYACNRLGGRVDSYFSNLSAKEIARGFLKAIKGQKLSKIANYIHPKYGITITNKLSFIEPGAIEFSKASFIKFYKNGQKLNWGRSYGRGDIIQNSLKKTLSKFVRPIYKVSKIKTLRNLKGFKKVAHVKAYQFFWQETRIRANYNWLGTVVILAKSNSKWYVVGLLRERWTI